MPALNLPDPPLRRILDAIPDGIGVEHEGRIVWANVGFAHLYGYGSVQEVIGLPMDAFVAVEDRERLLSFTALRWRGESAPDRYRFRGVRRDGSRIDVEIFVSSFQEGGRMYVLGALRDLGERLLLARRMETAQRLEAVGTLARGISHDFNNLLGSILGSVEMLEATSDSRPGVARYLDRIRVAVERGSELTRQIQAFTGHQRWQGHTARPVGIVGETLSLLSHGNTQGLVLRDLCDGGLPPVAMAPGQLQQILMNLGINAIDAMPGGGVLEMGARLEELGDIEFQTLGPGRYVRFWVEDTGLGIPAAHLDRIFEPFYTTKGPDKGTGLGLSVVVGALHAHGGDISVESEEGSGSRFTFLLPVAERELTEVDASASEDDEFVTGNGERLLVVDDDPGMRSYFEELLGGRGFDVLAVSSGYEALALAPARISSLRLMVVDLVMPGMDGVECAIEMTKRNPDLALVLCTGLVQDERLALLPRDRLVGILRKPVSARQLLSKVRLALGVNAR